MLVYQPISLVAVVNQLLLISVNKVYYVTNSWTLKVLTRRQMHMSFSILFDCLPDFYQLFFIGFLCVFDICLNRVIQKVSVNSHSSIDNTASVRYSDIVCRNRTRM